jgi:uncharacterized SAM-dependent methyltransferase
MNSILNWLLSNPIRCSRSEVALGLSRNPKSWPCKFLYDYEGSLLFNRICESEEYYPTRTEISILRSHAEEIGSLCGPGCMFSMCGAGFAVLIGADMRKPRALLERAYNDSQGVTAAFNLNVLRRINHELNANFRLDQFAHIAAMQEFEARLNIEHGGIELSV